MSTITSRKINSSIGFYHKDGLLDIFIGLGIFFAGLFLWTEMVWLSGIFIPVFMPSFLAARKRFLQPRFGNPDHNLQQPVQAQKLIFLIILLLGGLLLAWFLMSFIFGFMSGPINEWLRQYFLLMIGIIFAIVWIFASAMLRINRFYLYAFFTFLALSFAQFTSLLFWVALSVLGGLISFFGLIILFRFVQQHPLKN